MSSQIIKTRVLAAKTLPSMTITTSSAAIEPTHAMLPSPTPSLFPIPTFNVSSPLEDITIIELSSIISTPFDLIGIGYEDGHHGTDFAYYSRGAHTTMKGLTIHSVLSGKVAAVISDQKPYGNLIIIETPLNRIPQEMLTPLKPSAQQTPYPYNPRMQFCESLKTQSWVVQTGSIYLLYGHMLEPSPLTRGEIVASGQQIGKVGTTGMSRNEHLHLEMRWGPTGTEFASMNYYDTAATQEEMDNYCMWRISGKFTLLDPMSFFSAWQSISNQSSN